MTPRERFLAVLNFQPVDRLPAIEVFHWWDKTIARWHDEGLPARLAEHGEIAEHLGLDVHRYTWLTPRYCLERPEGRPRELGWIAVETEYDVLRREMFDLTILDFEPVTQLVEQQRRGEIVFSLQVDGFFWFQREMLGIERHLLAFYDEPRLLHRISADLAEFLIRLVDAVCDIGTPDIVSFAEDMSYNHGSMLSRACFDEFMAPYYRRVLRDVKRRGILPFVDTDGNVHELLPWLADVGVEGVVPLERRAGNDIAAIRTQHPRFRMMGGFDKTVMHRGEGAIRAEFERVLPVMRSGGYIVSCDHQTPPEVSLEDYHLYAHLLREYCERAAH